MITDLILSLVWPQWVESGLARPFSWCEVGKDADPLASGIGSRFWPVRMRRQSTSGDHAL
jgi:hypothetical protein